MTLAALPRLALGLAGLISFLANAALAWWAPLAWQLVAIPAFLYYSAVILAFLGGAGGAGRSAR
ncbi:hypothetical protein [Halomonas sp. BM-2019]|uniref:hypothetical protein n=1 Tax=Halomonas sp. BM-2019 TaxID=2811227 RepID=UPI001B3C2A2A|nr:MAG: hypothetical protein J5F18_06075 [Halomonas sp. BM-2019]